MDLGVTWHRRPDADPAPARCRTLLRNRSGRLGRWASAVCTLEPRSRHRTRGVHRVGATAIRSPIVGCSAQRGFRPGPGRATPPASARFEIPHFFRNYRALARLEALLAGKPTPFEEGRPRPATTSGSAPAVTLRTTRGTGRMSVCGSDAVVAANAARAHSVPGGTIGCRTALRRHGHAGACPAEPPTARGIPDRALRPLRAQGRAVLDVGQNAIRPCSGQFRFAGSTVADSGDGRWGDDPKTLEGANRPSTNRAHDRATSVVDGLAASGTIRSLRIAEPSSGASGTGLVHGCQETIRSDPKNP